MPLKTPRKPRVVRPIVHEAITTREAKLYLALVHALLALRLPDMFLGTILHNIELARRIPEDDEIIHVLCTVAKESGRGEMLARAVVACDEAIAQNRPIRPEDLRFPETEDPTTPRIIVAGLTSLRPA